MAVFKKTNKTIIDTGGVVFEGNQDMGGKRVRRAGEEVGQNDYVIKNTLDNHDHTQYVHNPHTHPPATDHDHPYSPTSHPHDDWLLSFGGDENLGYQLLPDNLMIQWGRTTWVQNPDRRRNNGNPAWANVDGAADDYTASDINTHLGVINFHSSHYFNGDPFNVAVTLYRWDGPGWEPGDEEVEHIVGVRSFTTSGVSRTGFHWDAYRHRGYNNGTWPEVRDCFQITWFAFGKYA